MSSKKCVFVTDLHGKEDRFDLLFRIIAKDRPDGVFIGGDILPGGYGMSADSCEFMNGFGGMVRRAKEKSAGTRFFVIMGNDDPRILEYCFLELEKEGMIYYVHQKVADFGGLNVVGYSFVPPSPFLLKDWEKYDVSRFTGVGAVSPEEGTRTVEVSPEEARYSTIEKDLIELAGLSDPGNTIYLFHSPPYETCLDRLDNDGKFVDHAPADTHVGSIAIRRFIESKKPFLTLHGHIHESIRLTGKWRERLGPTHVFGASHDGPGLAIVRFSTGDLENATREVLTPQQSCL